MSTSLPIPPEGAPVTVAEAVVPAPAEQRRTAWLVAGIATLAFVLFRIPVLINPGGVNSDGAVTALQSWRMMAGDFAILHWGRDYLLSVDSIVAIPFYWVFGKSAYTAMGVTLLGQLTSMWLSFAVVRKRLGAWPSLWALLPLVMATMAFNIYLYFYIREWCLATAMLSFFLLDGAAESRFPLPRYAAGVVAGFMAMFLDLFAVQFIGPVLLFAILCAFDKKQSWKQLGIRLGVVLVSIVAGYLLLKLLQKAANVSTGRAAWSMDRIPGNFQLLWTQCLPWLVGWKIFALADPIPVHYPVPKPVEWFQALGGVLWALAMLSSGVLFFFFRRIPWEVRRLGAIGLGVATASVAGFLVTHTATDIWAGRMLAPMLLTMPFAFAPAIHLLKGWKFPAVMAPYFLSLAVSCWVGYGYYTSGVLPVRTERGKAHEEADVAKELRSRGIKYAGAQYWLAYRLTMLFQEDPIVVPLASEDRYPPYRQAFDHEAKIALIFHPSMPWLLPEHFEPQMKASGAVYEKFKVHDFTIITFDRSQQPKG